MLIQLQVISIPVLSTTILFSHNIWSSSVVVLNLNHTHIDCGTVFFPLSLSLSLSLSLFLSSSLCNCLEAIEWYIVNDLESGKSHLYFFLQSFRDLPFEWFLFSLLLYWKNCLHLYSVLSWPSIYDQNGVAEPDGIQSKIGISRIHICPVKTDKHPNYMTGQWRIETSSLSVCVCVCVWVWVSVVF